MTSESPERGRFPGFETQPVGFDSTSSLESKTYLRVVSRGNVAERKLDLEVTYSAGMDYCFGSSCLKTVSIVFSHGVYRRGRLGEGWLVCAFASKTLHAVGSPIT